MAITYHAGRRIQGISNNVNWDSSNTSGFSISGNTITSTTTGWVTNYARSTQSFTVGNGEIEITGTFTTSSYDGRIGFNNGTVSASNFNNFEWFVEVGGASYVMENNSQKFQRTGTRSQGDLFKTVIDNSGVVKYYVNGVLQYTSLNTASGTYYIDAHTSVSGSIITGTLAETKPTNVQVGSRFEETDTRKMYHNNSTGDVTTDGSYTVLKYKSGGTFTPTSAFNVEYLVVGGGGSGGSANDTSNSEGAGGGGSGGYRTATGHAVTAQAYSITVGAGGSATTGLVQNGNNGDSSVFDTITSTGGGAGGSGTNGAGASGGSGGGSGSGTSAVAGGSSTAYGNNGGAGTNVAKSGGGGGSGAVGQDGASAASATGGFGGVGTSSSITGSAVTRGSGGGGGGYTTGGLGGTGGGGNGGSGGNGNSGTANTGSGGGGASRASGTISGTGGSGIVILRFLTSGNTYTDTRLPNSQVGSRFEETDTRKMYHRDDVDFKEENGNEATNYRSASWYEQLSGETP